MSANLKLIDQDAFFQVSAQTRCVDGVLYLRPFQRSDTVVKFQMAACHYVVYCSLLSDFMGQNRRLEYKRTTVQRQYIYNVLPHQLYMFL